MVARAQWVLMCLSLFASCRCGDPDVKQLQPADVTATPASVSFPATYVGQRATSALILTNRGEATAPLELSIDAPFTSSTDQLSLTRGQAESIELTFAPSSAGTFTATLRAGDVQVHLEGIGLEVPECVAPAVCVVSQFDFAAATCRETREPDGTPCETSCVSGACLAGECLGGLKGCDDANACTLDACSETSGCSHVPRTCPVVNDPCKVATCDPVTGCGSEPVPDGTLCGPDECKALRVDVCISGECVERPRPMTGRCANRWVPTAIPEREGHAMAYDSVRRRVVLFGGGPGPLADTWEWDGQRWLLRTPAASPPAREHHAMAWDPTRQRVVLFGGLGANDQPLGDTWEWDGSNWVQRRPSLSPPARSEHALVLDVARQRVVLISGRSSTALLNDLWEWNGSTWTSRPEGAVLPARRAHAAAYDSDRQCIVVFGGVGDLGYLSDTWEWDGARWDDRSTQQPIWAVPTARAFSRLAYDSVRHRILLFHGVRADGVEAGGSWEWDGTYWASGPQVSAAGAGSGLAVDTDRQRIVIFAGAVTSEWDGMTWQVQRNGATYTTGGGSASMVTDSNRRRVLLFRQYELLEWSGDSWTSLRPPLRGPSRVEQALAWDTPRQRLVLFGGQQYRVVYDPSNLFEDTWEWDSTQWLLRAPASSPAARGTHVMAFDGARQEVLLVGGSDGARWFSDTWTWDGVTWTLRSSLSPSFEEPALAYDEARQRAVLFGGETGETWTWNGQQWQQQHPLSSPSGRTRHSMAYDPSRQRVLLFGGFRAPDFLAETWEWDGATWLQRAPLASPPAGDDQAMAFDPVGERMMLLVNGVTWLFLP